MQMTLGGASWVYLGIGRRWDTPSELLLMKYSTWDQIYGTIAEALGVEANIVHIPSDFIGRVAPRLAGSLLGDKTWSAVFDNSKIKKFVPGFQAEIDFREGVRRTLAWFAADERRQYVDETVNAEMEAHSQSVWR